MSNLSERRDRAVEEGKLARSLGKPKSVCPYNPSTVWGLHHFWLMGWDQQRYAEEIGLTTPAPKTLRELLGAT